MTTLRLLGGAFVEVDGRAQTGAVARRHPLAFLALLARAPSRQLSRDRLVEQLWPKSSPRRARHRLRDTVYTVRGALGSEAVLSVGDDLRLDAARLRVDVLEFDSARDRGAFAEAVALYAGPFLDGFHLGASTNFEHWAEAERIELAHAYRTALRRLAEEAEGRGEARGAASWWYRLAREEPYDADAALGVMRVLAAAGDVAGALRHADLHAARLAGDLDVAPHESVLAMARRLRQTSPGYPHRTESHGSRGPAPRSIRRSPESPRPKAQVRETRRSGRRHRVLGWTLGTMGLLAALGLATTLARTDGPTVDDHLVAVFPFEILGNGQYSYLEQGLVDLLSIKLALTDETRTVDPMALVSRTGRERSDSDLASLARLARRFGAGTFVLGSVVQSDGEAQIIATLYSTERLVPRAVATVSLPGEAAMFEEVDRLSRQLLSGWLSNGSDGYTSLAGITTTSLPAFKAYLGGERALREGRYRESVERFTEATDLDPGFALAHYRTSVAANWAGLPDLIRSGAEMAWQMRHQLPERAQRMLQIQHMSYDGSYDVTETARLLRGIVADYPWDIEALYQFADFRFHNGWIWGLGSSEVREDFERVLFYDGEHPGALTHLIRIVARQGDHRALDTLLQRGLSIVAEGRSRYEMEALAAFTRRDRTAQRRVVEKLRDLDDESLYAVAAVTLTFTENLADAGQLVELLRQADRAPRTRAFGRVWSASIQAARGRMEEARALLDAEESDPDLAAFVGLLIEITAPIDTNAEDLERARDRLASRHSDRMYSARSSGPLDGYVTRENTILLLALASARQGNASEAHRYADQVEPDPESSGLEARGILARAAAALSMEDPEEALRLLDTGEPTFQSVPATWPTFLRAEALRSVGAAGEALRWYGALPSDYVFTPLVAAVSHLRRAELYRQLRHPREAERHFGRAAELWEDADPEFDTLFEKRGTRAAEQRALSRCRFSRCPELAVLTPGS